MLKKGKTSLVGERQFGRHLGDNLGEGNRESKIVSRQWGDDFCCETARCLARPSGWPKNRGKSSARNGEKMAQEVAKNGIWGHLSIFRHFSNFGPRTIFSFPASFVPDFGFGPVFQSIPGSLTRNGSSKNFQPFFGLELKHSG